jgi:hypothetical protein
MKKTISIITGINEVRNNEVLVSLSNMRADLTDCLAIKLSEIKEWFGVDDKGYSIEYSIKVGQKIEFELPCDATRKLTNVRFLN